MPIYEGNTVEEAIAVGLRALEVAREEVEVNILNEGKKGFLGLGKQNAKVSIEPTVTEEISEAIEATVEDIVVADEAVKLEELTKETDIKTNQTIAFPKVLEHLEDEAAIKELAVYLTNISKELNAPALVRIERLDNKITFHLDTEKQGLLIGKHGKVLNALQYLAQVFIHRVADNKLSVVVNIGDYREKRQAILERLAKRTADKAKQTGRPVFLEPMPAFERKQIHSVLSKDEEVNTYSEGDEPYRYLVVEPAKRKF